ncbi:hypothetical protein CYMTET_46004 [Cymbomonas tetramitiformis]|uniref:Uncharacterized protein n=1 Tax=Cymbomonas tetramitiformis TaxID=36881 RepID=A0AAE0BZ30_9CHLO|nr:hypothetical protein CYMTET_46004 [Cymbomonas tetramitiformis]
MSEQVDLAEDEPEGDEAEGEEPPFDTLARLGREWNAMSDALVEHEADGDVRDTWALAYAAARLAYPEYPLDKDGRPLRIGSQSRTRRRIRKYDKYGLPL